MDKNLNTNQLHKKYKILIHLRFEVVDALPLPRKNNMNQDRDKKDDRRQIVVNIFANLSFHIHMKYLVEHFSACCLCIKN